MKPMSLWLPDAAATDALGQLLAATQPAQAVVHLHGELGAGKSTLARAWLRELGVEGLIRSPTYTLVERYPLAAGGEALHIDLYRIGDAGELEFLGLDASPARLWLVEWPQRGLAALPAPTLRVMLAVEDGGRRCLLEACDRAGQDWLATDAMRLRLQGFHEP
jgi:tRNA threonylcarbamoyladenosine biosynthesis protein TsaE